MIHVFLIAALGFIGTAFVIKPYYLSVAKGLLVNWMISQIKFSHFKKHVIERELQNGSP